MVYSELHFPGEFLQIKVATAQDQGAIFDFEKKKKQQMGLPEMEVTMASWEEPWREESLAFYLKTGWCFIARDGDKVGGYLLAQPMLFVQGYTQALWVDYVSAKDSTLENELLDVAYRWERSKHLQKVLFNTRHIDNETLQTQFPKLRILQAASLASSKISED